MKAGRELDVLIAGLMGLPLVRCDARHPTANGYCVGRLTIEQLMKDSNYYLSWSDAFHLLDHGSVPHYSTKIEDAWKVMEWLREQRSNVSLSAANGWGCHVWDVRWDDTGHQLDSYAEPARGHGDTAPEAICNCALEMVK